MAEKIKVDYKAVSDAVTKMNNAINRYNSLTEKGFDNAISTLDGMNSDYVDKLQQVLDCLNPKVKTKMTNIMTAYTQKTSYASDTFKTADDDIGSYYKGE